MERSWENFGILLKKERQRNQMSRKELAEKINKKEATIISWEQGIR
ncbi:MAG: helix-turn-helix domain-containing protein, partial [Candidatus Thorarchaeota archaeon]|nr:helix-turn-helix domain-containing protein [Candidatus Thorarchaeota archaeon]